MNFSLDLDFEIGLASLRLRGLDELTLVIKFMNRKSYVLKIDNPCKQEWASMTKNNLGKFCSYCSKTVVDFTQLTDNEVLQIIEQNSGKLCGRLTQKQLNREIQLYQPLNNSRL